MKYVVTHSVAACTLKPILALHFVKWARADAFMNAMPQKININLNFVELIMHWVLERTAVIAASDMPSNFYECSKSMLSLLKIFSDS